MRRGSLMPLSGIFGYSAGIIGLGQFLLGYPQGKVLSGKSEPYSTTISTSFFIAAVV
jgi:hypothetical protein